MIYLSPGVYVQEVDLSLYVPNLSTTAFGVVGLASKGPINTPTNISDSVAFASTFGDPNSVESLYGPYAALQYLSQGRQLIYVRVSSTDDNGNPLAEAASLDLSQSATPATLLSAKTSSITLTTSNNTLVFHFDGATGSTDYGYVAVTVPITAPGVTSQLFTMQQVAGYLNSNSTFGFFATASVTAAGKLLLTHNFNGSAHAMTGVGAPLTTAATSGGFGFSSSTSQGVGVVLAAPRLYSSVFSSGNMPDISSLSGGDPTLIFDYTFVPAAGSYITLTKPSGTAYATITGDVFPSDINGQTIVVSSGDHAASYTVTQRISSTVLTLGSGDDGWVFAHGTFHFAYEISVVFNAYGSGTTVDSFVQSLRANKTFTDNFFVGTPVASGAKYFFITATRSSGASSLINVPTEEGTNIANLIIFGEDIGTGLQRPLGTSPQQVLNFTATSPGTWGNKLAVSCVDAGSGNFNVLIWEKGNVVERFNGLNRSTPVISTDAFGTPGANPFYVVNAINGKSARVTVTDLLADQIVYANYLPVFSTGSDSQALVGGTNGLPASNDVSAYIGSNSEGIVTGLQIFRNPEQQDINLLAVPGVFDAAVINEMINICETRRDVMCIVDSPRDQVNNKSLTPQQVVDWHNGVGVFADHQAFNSSYAALYWPWLQIYDSVNKVSIWVPPSGLVAAAYAFNDYSSEPWFAPAGLNRGHLSTPTDADYKPSLGDRDLLYSNGNAVNPIATFKQVGINIWGQRTLQRAPTSLDRVGVRRMMLYLEKVVSTSTLYLLFQPNNSNTWTQFIDVVTPILSGVQARQGINGYQVRCDSTTNTPDVVANNQMNALIFIQPTLTVEMIQLTMVLTAQGASFSEIVF